MKKFDIFKQMVYNGIMEKITTAIIGGGAAGLLLATSLSSDLSSVTVFERGERVGRKLSATGNGQGNITNLGVNDGDYFSFSPRGNALAKRIIRRFDHRCLIEHFERAGLLLTADERGRVYPAGRQASALTDGLRFLAVERGVKLCVSTQINDIVKQGDGFVLTAKTAEGERKIYAETVVLCTGGKAAKNFGTDGSAYALAQKFGHTLTKLYPSLVQLKTETAPIKTLKGIKVTDAEVTAKWQGGEKRLTGDILFTDYGVSGDAIFRLSAYLTAHLESGASISVDFLPAFSKEKIAAALLEKSKNFPNTPTVELLCGMLNNQLARAVMKRVNGHLTKAAHEVKNFSLQVLGSLGFDYAQVTKGGICIDEVDENLQSKLVKGLYFAGETLDIDGECGGFNLQWAYSSACIVASAIEREKAKARGQV